MMDHNHPIRSDQCAVCNQASLYKCSLCGQTSYCSKKCQKSDWKKHKSICKKDREKPNPIILPQQTSTENISHDTSISSPSTLSPSSKSAQSTPFYPPPSIPSIQGLHESSLTSSSSSSFSSNINPNSEQYTPSPIQPVPQSQPPSHPLVPQISPYYSSHQHSEVSLPESITIPTIEFDPIRLKTLFRKHKDAATKTHKIRPHSFVPHTTPSTDSSQSQHSNQNNDISLTKHSDNKILFHHGMINDEQYIHFYNQRLREGPRRLSSVNSIGCHTEGQGPFINVHIVKIANLRHLPPYNHMLTSYEKTNLLQNKVESLLRNHSEIIQQMSLLNQISKNDKEKFIQNQGLEGLISLCLLEIQTQERHHISINGIHVINILAHYFATDIYNFAHLWKIVYCLPLTFLMSKDATLIEAVYYFYSLLVSYSQLSIRNLIESECLSYEILACDFLEYLPLDNTQLRIKALNVAYHYLSGSCSRITPAEINYLIDLIYQMTGLLPYSVCLVWIVCSIFYLILSTPHLKICLFSAKVNDILMLFSSFDLPEFLIEMLQCLPHYKSFKNIYLNSPLCCLYYTPPCDDIPYHDILTDNNFLYLKRNIDISFEFLQSYAEFHNDPLLAFNNKRKPRPAIIQCYQMIQQYITNLEEISPLKLYQLADILHHDRQTIFSDNIGEYSDQLCHASIYRPNNKTLNDQHLHYIHPTSEYLSLFDNLSLNINPPHIVSHLYLHDNWPNVYTAPQYIPSILQHILCIMNIRENRSHPLKMAFWIHQIIYRLHPFMHHNREIARLASNWILLKNGYCPIFFYDYRSYEKAIVNDKNQFFSFMIQNMLHTIPNLDEIEVPLKEENLSHKIRGKVINLKEEGNIAYKTGDINKALEYYCEALKLDNHDLRLYTNYALCLFKQDHCQEALVALFQAARLSSSDVKTRYLQGRALEGLNRLEEAKQAYRLALDQARASGNTAIQDITTRVQACERDNSISFPYIPLFPTLDDELSHLLEDFKPSFSNFMGYYLVFNYQYVYKCLRNKLHSLSSLYICPLISSNDLSVNRVLSIIEQCKEKKINFNDLTYYKPIPNDNLLALCVYHLSNQLTENSLQNIYNMCVEHDFIVGRFIIPLECDNEKVDQIWEKIAHKIWEGQISTSVIMSSICSSSQTQRFEDKKYRLMVFTEDFRKKDEINEIAQELMKIISSILSIEHHSNPQNDLVDQSSAINTLYNDSLSISPTSSPSISEANSNNIHDEKTSNPTTNDLDKQSTSNQSNHSETRTSDNFHFEYRAEIFTFISLPPSHSPILYSF